jgi:betaine lipid synthase
MHATIPLDQFEAIYLVDLCEPLLNVARQRLKAFPNVHIVNADATVLPIDRDQVDVVTMSYSLSMIPPYLKVVDRVLEILRPEGLVSVVDFFTSNKDEGGEEPGRQGNLINRLFWKTWFEFDHVDLNPARRDYLEHKFQVVKSLSCRNRMVLPSLISIPYYIYLGEKPSEQSSRASTPTLERMTSSVVKHAMPATPDASPLLLVKHNGTNMPELQMPEAMIVEEPAWVRHRRPYDPTAPDQSQFKDFIYSFVWEDPATDIREMDINSGDEMLVITSAGDNALDYLVNAGPRHIHCVDMNPCQGHLLELKMAAFQTLTFEETWSLFGAGQRDDFPELLDRMSPKLSRPALQFWHAHAAAFEKCFYKSGYAGNVLKVLDGLFLMTGTKQAALDMALATDLTQQRKAWKRLRRAFINPVVGTVLMANPVFLWHALGVPMNQFRMLLKEGSALQYGVDTLDPISNHTLLSGENFHYLLPLLQHYTRSCCPTYLKEESHKRFANEDLLDRLTLWTDTINGVLAQVTPHSLTKAIVMDHQDWFETIDEATPFPTDEEFLHARQQLPCLAHEKQPSGVSYLDTEIWLFKQALKPMGQVWFRSAAKRPWYIKRWERAGFTVINKGIRGETTKDGVLDLVNMYASCWCAELQ